MSKILITGGAGFIGAHVARALTQRGENIHIIDDFNDRYDPRLKEHRVHHLLGTENVTISRVDIRNQEAIDNIFTTHQFDKVIHLAAWASVQPSIENPYVYTSVNVDGTVNIFEAARKNNIEHIVFASSSSVYGGLTKLPFQETMNVNQPISPYAATKRACELFGATWNKMHGISLTGLRFFTVYGAWGRPEMAMFTFAHAILNNLPLPMRGKDTMRDFTYIDDIVQGVVSALDNPKQFQIYNLGKGDGVPLPRLIAALEKSFDKPAVIEEVPLPAGDIPATLADNSLAKKDLNYVPVIPIEKGVEKFAEWYINWYVPTFEESATGITAPAA